MISQIHLKTQNPHHMSLSGGPAVYGPNDSAFTNSIHPLRGLPGMQIGSLSPQHT